MQGVSWNGQWFFLLSLFCHPLGCLPLNTLYAFTTKQGLKILELVNVEGRWVPNCGKILQDSKLIYYFLQKIKKCKCALTALHIHCGDCFLSDSTCLSIQSCLRARMSANNKGSDCGSGCIIFLELAIMFQVRDWGLVQGTELSISGEWVFIRGWEALGLREKNGALKIGTFSAYRNYPCMTNHFYSVLCGQQEISPTYLWGLAILRSENVPMFNQFLENNVIYLEDWSWNITFKGGWTHYTNSSICPGSHCHMFIV